MVKEVNPMIHTNAWDFPHEDYHCSDPEKKKLVTQLAVMITDNIPRKLPGGMKENHMDFWILDRLLTKDEVKFMLSFEKRRVGRTTAWLAKKNGLSRTETQKIIDHLLWIGILEQNRDNADQHIQYSIPKWVVGSGEYMVEHPTLCDDHPEVATMFNYAPQEPLELAAKLVPPGGAGIGMHVIPVEKAIDPSSTSVSVEHLSHWLKKYDKFCAMVCACRKAQRYRGEGVGDIEGYMCIGVGDIAEFLVESGKDAHYITRDEAMEIIMRAERKGYVHQITNLDGPDRIVGICNCSPGSCYGLRTSQLFNTPNMSRSAYRAHVNAKNCVACGKCVEVCPSGAAKLGQRFCHADGSPVMYPMHELPDDHVWGEDKWDRDYRDHNKINCYDTGTAPCKTACPAHLAVQGYIRMAAEGRYEEAVHLIRQDNPFPAVCGAVCNRRCEGRCTRGTVDKPVAIDEIKKYISQYELAHLENFVPICDNMDGNEWTDYKIAVIGAGPAGLSAAWYLRTEGYPVTVFEKEARPGGMLMNGIPNFRLEKNVLAGEIRLVEMAGAEIRCGIEVGKDISIQQLREQGYRAFYIAIGLQGGRLAGVPGEDADGVMSGVEFLRKVNLMTAPANRITSAASSATDQIQSSEDTYKASPDLVTKPLHPVSDIADSAGKTGSQEPDNAPVADVTETIAASLSTDTLHLPGDIVVVGGGNVAADVARAALRTTDGHVTMLCLEQRNEMPAAKDEVAELEKEGIELRNGWGPKEVLFDEVKNPDGTVTKKVKAVVFKRCTQVKNAEGRFDPQYDENDTITIPCRHVLMAIGQAAEWGHLLDGTKVKLRRGGTAIADPVTLETDEPDIFVGGDIFHGARFAIDAIADGKTGMVSINRFVHPGQSMTIGRDLREFIELDRDDIRFEGYDNADRQTPGMRHGTMKQITGSFEDFRLPFTEEQVQKEAARCLKCGATVVDLNKCIGCGLCTTRCQFDAIHLTRDIPEASDMHKAEEMMDVVKPYLPKRAIRIVKRRLTGKSDYPTEQTNGL